MSEQPDYNSGEGKDLPEKQPSADAPANSDGALGVLQGETHLASDARMIGRAIRERWGMPADVLKHLPGRALAIAMNGANKTRDQIRAMELLRHMHADNQRADEVCMKDERLDQGLPTERIELKPITLRVAERINSNPSDKPADPSDEPAR